MRIKLYKQFEHWYHGGTIWLYSDPHFDDPETYEINPSWMSSEEQVKRINENLSKNDTIIFLGDIGNEDWIKKIKGYKVLLLGNHDKGVSNYKKKYHAEYKFVTSKKVISYDAEDLKDAQEGAEEMMRDCGLLGCPKITNNGMFDEVYEGPLFINDKILLSHEPIDLPFGINIHGHCHSSHLQSVYWAGKRARFNVAADVIGFQKIRLDKIVEKFHTLDIHRLTINKAI